MAEPRGGGGGSRGGSASGAARPPPASGEAAPALAPPLGGLPLAPWLPRGSGLGAAAWWAGWREGPLLLGEAPP